MGQNRAKSIAVVLAMLLAYGFYISSYTLNIDDIFTDFYNGGRLIAAGRFTGWLLQLFTGFLTYSPFFTMALAMGIYFFAGLVYAIILKQSSRQKLSDVAVFVFWIVFVTYPIIAEQMVYPIIHLLALGYLLVALSLHLFLAFLQDRKWSKMIAAAIMMVLAIDFYESFASVFLTFLMSLVMVRYLYGDSPAECSWKGICGFLLKAVLFLGCAIVIRTIIAMAFMYGWYGTLKSGYSGNSGLSWFAIGPFDCAFWLARTLFLSYFWAAVAYFPIFLFVLSCILGLVLALGISCKRKSLLPLVLFIGLVLASLSLNFLLGLAVKYTMAQALTPFVAFVIAWGYATAEKHPVARYVTGFLVAILVLNQAKSLNAWSVLNFKRSQYELSIVDTIGRELVANYPVQSKPVLFLGAVDAPRLPECWQQENENNQVLVRLWRKAFLKISEALLPQKYLKNIGGFYNKEITNVQDLYRYVKSTRCGSSASFSYLSWLKGTNSWFSRYCSEPLPPFYRVKVLLADMGYLLFECPEELYQQYKEYPSDSFPAYPSAGYIRETEDAILVNFGE